MAWYWWLAIALSYAVFNYLIANLYWYVWHAHITRYMVQKGTAHEHSHHVMHKEPSVLMRALFPYSCKEFAKKGSDLCWVSKSQQCPSNTFDQRFDKPPFISSCPETSFLEYFLLHNLFLIFKVPMLGYALLYSIYLAIRFLAIKLENGITYLWNALSALVLKPHEKHNRELAARRKALEQGASLDKANDCVAQALPEAVSTPKVRIELTRGDQLDELRAKLADAEKRSHDCDAECAELRLKIEQLEMQAADEQGGPFRANESAPLKPSLS